MTLVPPYTQVDLDADVDAITNGIDDAIAAIRRIKEGWSQVGYMHPGTDHVEYIRNRVPWFDKNTAAGVALVTSGATTVRDAARLTGRAPSTMSQAVAATLFGQPNNVKPTILATGKPAPGRAVGTKSPRSRRQGGFKPRPRTAPHTDPHITEFLAFLRSAEAPRHEPRLKVVDERLHEFFDKYHIACSHKP